MNVSPLLFRHSLDVVLVIFKYIELVSPPQKNNNSKNKFTQTTCPPDWSPSRAESKLVYGTIEGVTGSDAQQVTTAPTYLYKV